MLHVALAYHQSKGDFVISSKQIIFRTILYGIGGWLIIYFTIFDILDNSFSNNNINYFLFCCSFIIT